MNLSLNLGYWTAELDDADAGIISGYAWRRTRCNKKGRPRVEAFRLDGTRVYLERLLLGLVDDGQFYVKFLNGNRLDFRRANLQVMHVVDHLVSQPKLRYHDPNRQPTSEYKGVHWASTKCDGRWCAKIRYEGTQRLIGWFKDEVKAAKAYDRRAAELYGAEAYLNFPQEVPTARRLTPTHPRNVTKVSPKEPWNDISVRNDAPSV
ncbi:MAG TPA: hypothetical protein VGN72_07730 [Tepidisphaeraceae bacterium]|jgi:hypothetical protein|nr:hypothetical protein [Tepidisphaeraceae bacterium]